MSEEDGPPPLEDMSEMVRRIQERSAQKLTPAPEGYFAEKEPIAETAPKSKAAPAPKKAESGLKRGFFNAPPKEKAQPKTKEPTSQATQKQTNPPQKKQEPEIVEEIIRPKASVAGASQNKAPVFPELQQLNSSMGSLFSSPKFMEKLSSDPQMLRMFMDPEIQTAFSEMGKDPSAVIRHQQNPKVRTFFAQFGEFLSTIE